MTEWFAYSTERVHNAYDAVRRGAVTSVPLPAIQRLLMKAYQTEFFSDQEAMLIERIETELHHGHGHQTAGSYRTLQ